MTDDEQGARRSSFHVGDGPDEIRKDGTGMWAFVDGGRRNLPGERPSQVKLFDPEGAVTIYDTPPPEETPSSYPSPND